jgi:hypothetical protein
MSSQIWVGMCDFVTHINKLAATVTEKPWTTKQQNMSLTIFPTY